MRFRPLKNLQKSLTIKHFYSIIVVLLRGVYMSMHLVGPYLTTTNYKKRKAKITKAKMEQWQLMWQDRNRQLKRQGLPKMTFEAYVDELHGRVAPPARLKPDVIKTKAWVNPRPTAHIPSLNSSLGSTAKAPDKVYTGTAMLGIGQLHKSNMVPVFKQEDAIDIAKMRRG